MCGACLAWQGRLAGYEAHLGGPEAPRTAMPGAAGRPDAAYGLVTSMGSWRTPTITAGFW